MGDKRCEKCGDLIYEGEVCRVCNWIKNNISLLAVYSLDGGKIQMVLNVDKYRVACVPDSFRRDVSNNKCIVKAGKVVLNGDLD